MPTFVRRIGIDYSGAQDVEREPGRPPRPSDRGRCAAHAGTDGPCDQLEEGLAEALALSIQRTAA